MAKLHKNARTTPKIRRALQQSGDSNAALAKRYDIDVATVRKWRNRQSTEDIVSRPLRTQSSLTPAQEQLILALRKVLCLPLDDLLIVSQALVKQSLSRAVVNRLLKRHHISKISDVLPLILQNNQRETFKKSPAGTIQISVLHVATIDKSSAQWLYIALDRKTRCVFFHVFATQEAVNPVCFLQMLKEYPLINFGQALLDTSFINHFRSSIKKSIIEAFTQQGIDVRLVQFPDFNTTKPDIVLGLRTFKELASVLSAFSDAYHHSVPLHSLDGLTPASKAMALQGFNYDNSKVIIDNVLRQIKSSSVIIARVKKSIDTLSCDSYSLPHSNNTNKGDHPMANANETIAELMKVEGAIAAVIADSDTGMVLAAASNGFDTDSAAAGNTRVMQAKRDTMKMLGLNDKIEDILITLGTQLHLIAPLASNDAIFGYLVVSKSGANLGMARAQLKSAMASLVI